MAEPVGSGTATVDHPFTTVRTTGRPVYPWHTPIAFCSCFSACVLPTILIHVDQQGQYKSMDPRVDFTQLCTPRNRTPSLSSYLQTVPLSQQSPQVSTKFHNQQSALDPQTNLMLRYPDFGGSRFPPNWSHDWSMSNFSNPANSSRQLPPLSQYGPYIHSYSPLNPGESWHRRGLPRLPGTMDLARNSGRFGSLGGPRERGFYHNQVPWQMRSWIRDESNDFRFPNQRFRDQLYLGEW